MRESILPQLSHHFGGPSSSRAKIAIFKLKSQKMSNFGPKSLIFGQNDASGRAKPRKFSTSSLLNFDLNTFLWIVKHYRFSKSDPISMIRSILESICWDIFQNHTFALKLNFCPKGLPEKRQRRVLRTIFLKKICQKLKIFCPVAPGRNVELLSFRPKWHL